MIHTFTWIHYTVFIILRIHFSNSLDNFTSENFMSEQWDNIASIEKNEEDDNLQITIYILDNHHAEIQNNKSYKYSDILQETKDVIIETTEFPKVADNYVLLRKMLRISDQQPRLTNTMQEVAGEKRLEEEISKALILNSTLTPGEEKRLQIEKDKRPEPKPTESSQPTLEQETKTQTNNQTHQQTISKKVTSKKPQLQPIKIPEETKESKLRQQEKEKQPKLHPTLSLKDNDPGKILEEIKKKQVKPYPPKSIPYKSTHTTKVPENVKYNNKVNKLINYATQRKRPKPTKKMSSAEYREILRENDVKEQRKKIKSKEKKLIDHSLNDKNRKKAKKEREKAKKDAEEKNKLEEEKIEHEKQVKLMYKRNNEKLQKIEDFLKDNTAASKFVMYEIKRIQKTKVVYDEYRQMIAQLEDSTFQKPRLAVLDCFKRFFRQIKYPKDVWKTYVNKITIWDPWIEDADEFPFKRLKTPVE